jgi:uncharacterized glyoxalase superfamily protein PhnB
MATVKPIPDGYHSVTPYLVVEGAAKVIEFAKQAFGAEELHRMNAPDGKILHAEIKIGDSRVMLGDAQGPWKPMPTTLYLYVPDVDAVYKRAVAAGGASEQEPADQFYGDRTSGVRDPAGNRWFIATHIEEVAPDEMARRAQAAMKQRQGA